MATKGDPMLERTAAGIGYRLLLSRQALGFDQGEFAAKAGIAANTYNQYEQGKNIPSLQMAYKIRDTHKLPLDWIYCGDSSSLRRETERAIDAIVQLRHPVTDPPKQTRIQRR